MTNEETYIPKIIGLKRGVMGMCVLNNANAFYGENQSLMVFPGEGNGETTHYRIESAVSDNNGRNFLLKEHRGDLQAGHCYLNFDLGNETIEEAVEKLHNYTLYLGNDTDGNAYGVCWVKGDVGVWGVKTIFLFDIRYEVVSKPMDKTGVLKKKGE